MRRSAVAIGVLLFGSMVATCANAEVDDVPWSTALTKRDIQMRAVTGWDYQPGYPKGTYPAEQPIPQPAPLSSADPDRTPEWSKPAPAVEFVPNSDPSIQPRTKTSIDAMFQFAHYKYYEKTGDSTLMATSGLKYGFGGSATGMIAGDWFVRFEGRYAFGDVDYVGSGNSYDEPDDTFELRIMSGVDLPYGRVVIAPYAGVGYRNLFNDGRGITSTGFYGYRRDSQYIYAPIGADMRYLINRDSLLSLRLEADPFIAGWQTTHLSDVDPTYPDVTNKQKWGFGFKGELMYQYQRFSLGPYVHFWEIQDSEPAECDVFGPSVCLYEPHNKTLEYGIQTKFRLY